MNLPMMSGIFQVYTPENASLEEETSTLEVQGY